jgi:N-acetylglucosamine-6-phosphate deacetylase
MNIPLESAVKCSTVNPAKALGIFDKRGSIAPGKYADVVLLDNDLNIKKVILRGRVL